MSRPAPTAQRNLSLTEELEKLEQSITLTLQEIDHNFSKAHRIVTTSILPLVEQYGEHSKAVWEASKFWKQFFEASANVSLSGYEELANDDEDTTAATEEETTVNDETVTTATDDNLTPRPRTAGGGRGGDDDDESTVTYQHQHQHHQAEDGDTSLLTDDGAGDLTGSTPRPPTTKTLTSQAPPSSSSAAARVVSGTSRSPKLAALDSPYEAMKRQMQREADPQHDDDDDGEDDSAEFDESESELLFRQKTARLPDMSMTPRPSLGIGGGGGFGEAARGNFAQFPARGGGGGQGGHNKDRLLHRILDKNYRLQATPHRAMTRGTSPVRWKVTGHEMPEKGKGKEATTQQRQPWQDSPMSSPEMAVPTLRSAAFMSPMRGAGAGGRSGLPRPPNHGAGGRPGRPAAAPRTPGVSVQTPLAAGRKFRDVFESGGGGGREEEEEGEEDDTVDDRRPAKRVRDEITWESDSDEDVYAGMSPPKTIQFAMPQSRLMQTPAREASKRIVEDILLTAGAAPSESEEYSPTMVKMNDDILDDTF